MSIQTESADITAENQFTDYVGVGASHDGVVTVIGTGSMTLTLQVLPTGESTPLDIDTITAAGRYAFPGGGGKWRVGCKTGDFTSGTMKAIIQG